MMLAIRIDNNIIVIIMLITMIMMIIKLIIVIIIIIITMCMGNFAMHLGIFATSSWDFCYQWQFCYPSWHLFDLRRQFCYKNSHFATLAFVDFGRFATLG